MIVRPTVIGRCDDVVTPQMPGNGTFAAPGRPDNQADVPGFFFQGQMNIPAELAGFLFRQIEHATYLLNAGSGMDGGGDENFVIL